MKQFLTGVLILLAVAAGAYGALSIEHLAKLDIELPLPPR
jgi:hypothetical protein